MQYREYLSHSRAYAFNKCKKAFSWKYHDKVKPLPSTLHMDSWERMMRGILIHSAMEGGFRGATNLQEFVLAAAAEREAKFGGGGLSAEQQALFPGMVEDSIVVAQAALDWLPLSDWSAYVHNGTPMVEARLELPLPGWKGFQGFADLVAVHKPTQSVWLLDYKSRGQFERDGVDQYNSQFAGYLKALLALGIPVVGSLLFELKPTPPKRESRVQRTDTGDSISGVRISEDGRFRTTPTLRSREFIDAYWEDFTQQALAIAEFRPEQAYRSMNSFNCPSCEYERLCQGELRGDDVESILSRHYSVPRESLRIVEEL